MVSRTDRYSEAAFDLAARHTGTAPAAVQRFGSGIAHFVFEAAFADRPSLVVRLTRPEERSVCANAARLSRRLRPLGVPLPALLEDGTDAAIPYLILARLPGTDLGRVLATLTADKREAIASEIARAQRIAGNTATAGRYGYAADPQDAPCASWAEVLEANAERARQRIASAGLFPPDDVDTLEDRIGAARAPLNAIAATPFLHDTTTKNVIVSPRGVLSGIVDVDDLCFGDPRYAAALTLASILDTDGPVSYVDAWLRASGGAKDGIFWLYVALFTVDFMGEHGQVFNGNEIRSSETERRRLRDQFAFAIERAQLPR